MRGFIIFSIPFIPIVFYGVACIYRTSSSFYLEEIREIISKNYTSQLVPYLVLNDTVCVGEKMNTQNETIQYLNSIGKYQKVFKNNYDCKIKKSENSGFTFILIFLCMILFEYMLSHIYLIYIEIKKERDLPPSYESLQ